MLADDAVLQWDEGAVDRGPSIVSTAFGYISSRCSSSYHHAGQLLPGSGWVADTALGIGGECWLAGRELILISIRLVTVMRPSQRNLGNGSAVASLICVCSGDQGRARQ